MKKAKIILSAVAALSIVAGVFAFKAHRSTDVLFYLSANGRCLPVPFLTSTTTSANTVTIPAGAVAGWYTTSLCNTTITTYATTSPN